MQIEAYFQSIQIVLTTVPFVQSMQLSYDKRGIYEGYIRGELYLLDGSVLHIREYVDVEQSIERLAYAYHYMATDGKLVFRYDNTDHHRHLNLPTHPHHKHERTEDHVIASSAPTLSDILLEIEKLIPIP